MRQKQKNRLLHLFCEYLKICTVEDIFTPPKMLAELLKPRPSLGKNVKFICVTVDEEHLWRLSFHFHEFLAHFEHLIPAEVVIYRTTVLVEVSPRLKATRPVPCASVFYGSVIFDKSRNPVIVIYASTGVCESKHLIPYKLRQLLSVLFHLTDDLCIIKLGKKRMSQCMRRNLVPLVDVSDVLRFVFGVIDLHPVADKGIRLAKQLGIQVERRLQPVFIEYFDKSLVLCHPVVVAEGDSFHFFVEHWLSPWVFFPFYHNRRRFSRFGIY